MRIGEVAEAIGVTTDAIRFYERSGFLPRPARQRGNNYRDYSAADAEHLRLLIDLRSLDIPLSDAARVAGWCHAGHCGETTSELPAMLAERRAAIAERMAGLAALDARLADLERHLSRGRRSLAILDPVGVPCCDTASTVTDVVEGGCSCCAPDPQVLQPSGARP